jgi:nitrite reductase (NO-forming)
MSNFRAVHHRETGPSAPVPTWPKSAVRIAFGFVWAIDAVFKWKLGFHKEFVDLVKKSGEGQPSWLNWWFKFWTDTISPHPHVWACSIAAIETLVALCLIFGFARKVTYIVSAFTALVVWAIAEGFGGPYTSSSTDVGAAVIYAFVSAALLVMSLQCGPSRLSVDYHIEQRVSWWHWLAEFGAHNHPAPAENTTAPLTPPTIPVTTAH